MKLERSIDRQIKALNQLLLFRNKSKTFDEWWMIFGSCSPEPKSIAIKVLSQTTSTTNCERNWSTFSYIHTKKRNRLPYNRLHRLVYTFYNMKLKMRTVTTQFSTLEIFSLFNPIPCI
ncbi:hypothetical protein Lal_00042524 [Lupinus albus]|nr:hypothetical protein Lal_00042524 [Lupinus albus]